MQAHRVGIGNDRCLLSAAFLPKLASGKNSICLLKFALLKTRSAYLPLSLLGLLHVALGFVWSRTTAHAKAFFSMNRKC